MRKLMLQMSSDIAASTGEIIKRGRCMSALS